MIISDARTFRAIDVNSFAWNNLRRFQHVPFVQREIMRLHRLAERWKDDARKQATQLRYCLIQAQEYFQAAAAVSLATRPNLLYYSVMSLALAEILLKHTGLSSLDRAREQHRHHGLTLRFQPQGPTGRPLQEAAAELSAIPLDVAGRRTGTFALWHQSAREMPLVGSREEHIAKGSLSSTRVIMGAEDAQLGSVPAAGLSLLDCLVALPGMADFLPEYRILPQTLRGRVVEDVHTQGKERTVTRFTIHPSPLAQQFLNNVLIEPGWVDRTDVHEMQSGCVFQFTSDPVNGAPRISVPHGSAWSIDEIRFWAQNRPLNEFGYLYVALFIAGNYARYYPDRWLSDVESSSPLALAIEELLAVAERRMALLTLSELSRSYFVSE